MTDSDIKAMEALGKRQADTAAEQTKPGPSFTPDVDIFETDTALTLLADIPGVNSQGIDIDIRDNVLSLVGEVATPEEPDETEILREYVTGKYLRQFSLSEQIDQTKINAELNDGVLRLTLPKVEKATPRKITVRAG